MVTGTMSLLNNLMSLGDSSLDETIRPMVSTIYANWGINDANTKAATDFPFAYGSTDSKKLYGNLGIYIYGFVVMLIVGTLLTGYVTFGLLDKYYVQILLEDPLAWLRRYN